MKSKNGFTLIELLAIIVILAIIAVITVPIILNIIENSKKGAATDSAYGYKDAVNKWYISKLQEDSGYTLNGNYNVSDGKLNNIEIPLSGSIPTNGTLIYSNNELTGGCLTIGDYKVTFDSKGSVSSTEKGSCDSSNIALSCADDEYLHEINEYVVTDQETCQIYFENAWECNGDEECLQVVSDYCAGNGEFTIGDDIIDGLINYSDIESFVSLQTIDSWCRPKNEECFNFSDNGDGTASVTGYLCGIESIFIPDSPGSNSGHYGFDTDEVLDVNIPSQLTSKNGKLTVTSIDNNAFGYSGITSVTIPDSVTTIGDGAFYDNRLTSITIPNSVTTIDKVAFYGNQLTYVVLGTNVTTIGDYAFSIVTSNSNINLTTIYNNTGRSFEWKNIVGSSSSANFETGTINHSAGSITVTTGYPSDN